MNSSQRTSQISSINSANFNYKEKKLRNNGSEILRIKGSALQDWFRCVGIFFFEGLNKSKAISSYSYHFRSWWEFIKQIKFWFFSACNVIRTLMFLLQINQRWNWCMLVRPISRMRRKLVSLCHYSTLLRIISGKALWRNNPQDFPSSKRDTIWFPETNHGSV